MKKKQLFIKALFLCLGVATSSQAQDLDDILFMQTRLSIDAQMVDADLVNWSARYETNDTINGVGFNFDNLGRRRSPIIPLYNVGQELVFVKRIAFAFEYSFAFTRDLYNDFGVGLGYREKIGKFGVRVFAMYNYNNYGIFLNSVERPDDKNLIINDRRFLAQRTNIYMGNRTHRIRPVLGFTFGSDNFSVFAEGWYMHVFDSQARVYARGRTLFPRRESLDGTDNRLDIRDGGDVQQRDWNFHQPWGFRIGIIFKESVE